MKHVAFVIQGKTFLKSMFPLVIFANSVGIHAHVFLYEMRQGKPSDNINVEDVKQWAAQLQLQNVSLYLVRNDDHVIEHAKRQKIDAIVCQDITHHGPKFCQNCPRTFSIGVFFDSLHCAHRIHAGLNVDTVPTRLYLPDARFENEFRRLVNDDRFSIASLGSPLYDHSIFVKQEKRDRPRVVFMTTLQSLVPKNVQTNLEKFMAFCNRQGIDLVVKSKKKTPWVFVDRALTYSHVVKEAGFPYSSLSLMLNSDLHISSYSTSAVEAEYFGLPCINLESVSNDKLIYAIDSIKNVYRFAGVFQSSTCRTITSDFENHYQQLTSQQASANEVITLESNNSLRILRDMLEYL